MLNTYHVSVELHEDRPDNKDEAAWFNAVVIAEHNHDDEASDEVQRFFEDHGIHVRVAHVWEVA